MQDFRPSGNDKCDLAKLLVSLRGPPCSPFPPWFKIWVSIFAATPLFVDKLPSF